MISVLKNVADELKTTGKLKKFGTLLNRADCTLADRVYERNQCTNQCLKPRTDQFNQNLNRCILMH